MHVRLSIAPTTTITPRWFKFAWSWFPRLIVSVKAKKIKAKPQIYWLQLASGLTTRTVHSEMRRFKIHDDDDDAFEAVWPRGWGARLVSRQIHVLVRVRSHPCSKHFVYGQCPVSIIVNETLRWRSIRKRTGLGSFLIHPSSFLPTTQSIKGLSWNELQMAHISGPISWIVLVAKRFWFFIPHMGLNE